MRNEILRDVIAGCAGVLAVAALIGLPKDSTALPQPQFQFQHAVLLPHFSMITPRTHATAQPRITINP